MNNVANLSNERIKRLEQSNTLLKIEKEELKNIIKLMFPHISKSKGATVESFFSAEDIEERVQKIINSWEK